MAKANSNHKSVSSVWDLEQQKWSKQLQGRLWKRVKKKKKMKMIKILLSGDIITQWTLELKKKLQINPEMYFKFGGN